jgi:hypothetical protein
MIRLRRACVIATMTGGLALGSAGLVLPMTASAQPVITGGLVNVTVTNLLNNNQVAVQILVNAAANICGLDVVVLAQSLASGPVSCTSRSGNQSLSITQP